MPTILTLRLHDGGRRSADVDLARLTPAARAIAEICATSRLRTRCPLIIESVQTRRQDAIAAGGQAFDRLRDFYGDAALDRPHHVMHEHWAAYPADSSLDPHAYLEGEAEKIPLGFYPWGADVTGPVPSAAAARADADILSLAQVDELLLAHRLSVKDGRWFAEQPRPVRHVYGRPQYRRAEIEAYVAAAVARA